MDDAAIIIPPRAPHGYAEVVEYFGDPKPTRSASGEWEVDPVWEAANMTRFDHPVLPTTPCPHCGAKQPGHLYVHKKIVDGLKWICDGWLRLQADDGYLAVHVACFAPRAQRGSNGLVPSLHTWGAAVDWNPCTNVLLTNIQPDDPRRTTVPLLGPKGEVLRDLPESRVQLFKQAGHFWGGEFHTRADFMHEQLATGL
jgi:hypothetical protein